MKISCVKEELKRRGQEQVLRFWERLSENERASLLNQIENIDWEIVGHWNCREDLSGTGNIQPIEGLEVDQIMAKQSHYFALGKEALQQGKVGAVLLAGGMGTRLGSDGPKGAFNIGVTRPLYIFEQQIRNLQEVCAACSARVPLFIMTSEKNDAQTQAFLREHSFFGYPEEDVYFFQQEMAACVDFEGKILLEERGRIATSPNGNGGWYSSLVKAGLDEVVKARGVEWLNVFAVDNVLQRIADPVFVGATLESGKNCGAKVVRKANPTERVGVLCLENGSPNVIEYYELTDEMANERDDRGELVYTYGVILNYLFRVQKLREITAARFPVHVASKKIPYIGAEGGHVQPECENGYKFETLIIDMVKLMGSCLPFEVVREREFAPIKNMTGVDSVQSARELLKKNGVTL